MINEKEDSMSRLKTLGFDTHPGLEMLNYTNEKEWLELRTKGIGGSDAAAVMGLNKYSSPLKVYRQKIEGEVLDLSDNVNVKKGKMLEPYIRDHFIRPFLEEQGYNTFELQETLINTAYPWLRANLDGLAVKKENPHHKSNFVIEIKWVSEYGELLWNGKDYCGIPVYYYAQVQEYMLVTDTNWAVVWAMFDSTADVVRYKIPRDEEFIAKLIKATKSFYYNHMLPQVPPLPDPDSDTLDFAKMIAELETKKPDPISSDAYDRLVLDYIAEKEMEKEHADKKKALEKKVKELYVQGYVTDVARVNISTFPTRRVNNELLKEQFPEVYEKVLSETLSSRFTVK